METANDMTEEQFDALKKEVLEMFDSPSEFEIERVVIKTNHPKAGGDWHSKSDAWLVSIVNNENGLRSLFQYFTGVGLRLNGVPRFDAVSFLNSLYLDYSVARDMTRREAMRDIGMAEEQYRACEEVEEKLAYVMGPKARTLLAKLEVLSQYV